MTSCASRIPTGAVEHEAHARRPDGATALLSDQQAAARRAARTNGAGLGGDKPRGAPAENHGVRAGQWPPPRLAGRGAAGYRPPGRRRRGARSGGRPSHPGRCAPGRVDKPGHLRKPPVTTALGAHSFVFNRLPESSHLQVRGSVNLVIGSENDAGSYYGLAPAPNRGKLENSFKAGDGRQPVLHPPRPNPLRPGQAGLVRPTTVSL